MTCYVLSVPLNSTHYCFYYYTTTSWPDYCDCELKGSESAGGAAAGRYSLVSMRASFSNKAKKEKSHRIMSKPDLAMHASYTCDFFCVRNW